VNKKRVSKAMKLPTGSTRSASRSLPDVEVEDTGSELSVCNRRRASVHCGVNVVVRTCIIVNATTIKIRTYSRVSLTLGGEYGHRSRYLSHSQTDASMEASCYDYLLQKILQFHKMQINFINSLLAGRWS